MSPLEQLICENAHPDLTVAQLCKKIDCNRTSVYRCIEQYGIELKQRKKPQRKENTLTNQIIEIAQKEQLTSSEIAERLNCNAKHVQNVLRVNNIDRLPRGARHGELNPSYIVGRSIDLDGYALVKAPDNHPYARENGRMYEHRLVLESKLGRYLLPDEVVDHIDGLHLHNDPSNLRAFASNADHLRATISGQVPNWSDEGWQKMTVPYHQRKEHPLVDNYHQRKKLGDVRLQQILLAAYKLGIDSPHLLGTHHLLEQVQIDASSRSRIEHAWASLYPELALNQIQ